MINLIVNYYHKPTDAQVLLGREILEDIEEVLLATPSNDGPIFFNKKFSGSAIYRWKVLTVSDHATEVAQTTEETPIDALVKQPRVLNVLLQATRTDEIYLAKSIHKGQKGLKQVLYPGKIIEVDYGHINDVYKSNGHNRSNKRYASTIQRGEMHKRRLAVVVAIHFNTVQAVPITSIDHEKDKSSFKIDANTLANICFYGESGKTSWVVCGMIETISTHRILPPEIIETQPSGYIKRSRNLNYPTLLNKSDKKDLLKALLHTIGPEYVQKMTKHEEILIELATLQARLLENESTIKHLEKFKAFCFENGLESEVHSDNAP
jgi:uncharacterized protein YifN (PemK superfamily)